MLINDEEMTKIVGGMLSSSLLNSVARLITTLLDWGRTIGSSIYRFKNKNYCN